MKRRPIRHVMINTNGVRIAQDPAFVERLASYAPRLEVYLQFNSLNDDALMDLRGAKLSADPPAGARGARSGRPVDDPGRGGEARRQRP